MFVVKDAVLKVEAGLHKGVAVEIGHKPIRVGGGDDCDLLLLDDDVPECAMRSWKTDDGVMVSITADGVGVGPHAEVAPVGCTFALTDDVTLFVGAAQLQLVAAHDQHDAPLGAAPICRSDFPFPDAEHADGLRSKINRTSTEQNAPSPSRTPIVAKLLTYASQPYALISAILTMLVFGLFGPNAVSGMYSRGDEEAPARHFLSFQPIERPHEVFPHDGSNRERLAFDPKTIEALTAPHLKGAAALASRGEDAMQDLWRTGDSDHSAGASVTQVASSCDGGAAAAWLRGRLETAGFDHLLVEDAAAHVGVSGGYPSAKAPEWQAIQNEYAQTCGDGAPLLADVTTFDPDSEVIEPPAVEAVMLSPEPAILVDGVRYQEGDELRQGVSVGQITSDFVDLQTDRGRVRVDF